MTKPELLNAVVQSQPTAFRAKRAWSIANVEELEAGALHFRLGREGRRSLPVKSESGDFVEEDVRIAPFVDVVLDTPLEICAIADRREVGSPQGIGRILSDVLNASSVAREQNVTVAASPIKEPRVFLERIHAASAIYALWVTTNRPNPFDADELFVKPTANVVEAIGAQQAKTTFSGTKINGQSDALEELVKSTAANGGNAGARILERDQSKTVSVTLGTSLASLSIEADAGLAQRALAKARDTYDRIRNRLRR